MSPIVVAARSNGEKWLNIKRLYVFAALCLGCKATLETQSIV
jgi:hypothetical protein